MRLTNLFKIFVIVSLIAFASVANCLKTNKGNNLIDQLKQARNELATYLQTVMPTIQHLNADEYPSDVKMKIKRLQGKIYMLQESVKNNARRTKS